MGLGERVRIARPPPGKEHLENLKATVVSLVPIAKHPFDYTICLDEGGVEHNLPADSLEPLTYFEVADEPGELASDVTIVNNLVYCIKHRLEVCGACGMDHRPTNYMLEMKPTEDMDVSFRLHEEMRSIGAPSRQAPSKKAKQQATSKAIFRPAVNAHLLTIPDGFDPSSCEAWPRGMPTEPLTRLSTAFGPTEPDVPEFAKLPVRRVRENIVLASRHWDRFLSSGMAGNEPMMRLLQQDDAQTQLISMDLVLPIRSLVVDQKLVPVFVVRWASSSATNMQDALAVMGTMERNTKMAEIPVEVDEMQLIADLLEKNGSRLDPAFVRSVEKHPGVLSVSVLSPISEAAMSAFYESLGDYCHQCGTSGVYVLKCSRCRQAAYCSKECQKKNWKLHKQSCQSP